MHHGVTFNFGSAKVSSPATFETCFSYDKDILISATDYYVHPPGGWIYYFCFFRRPMSDVRRPASDVRRHAWFPLI